MDHRGLMFGVDGGGSGNGGCNFDGLSLNFAMNYAGSHNNGPAPSQFPLSPGTETLGATSLAAGFKDNVFETPQSLRNSPQFNSVLTMPIVTLMQPGKQASCSVCGTEFLDQGYELSTCSHTYCKKCIHHTLGQRGRLCCICSLSTTRSPTHSTQQLLNTEKPGLSFATLECLRSPGFGQYQPPSLSSAGDSSNIDVTSHWNDPASIFNNSNGVRAPALRQLQQQNPLHEPVPSQIPSSCACGKKIPTARCEQCHEALCHDCVLAHQVVRITRDHHIIPLTSYQKLENNFCSVIPSFSNNKFSYYGHHTAPTATDGSMCPKHTAQKLFAQCFSCQGTWLCVNCIADHPIKSHNVDVPGDTKSAILLMVAEAEREDKAVAKAISGVINMSERIDSSVQSSSNNIRAEFHQFVSVVEDRKRDLLLRVDMLRNAKQIILKAQNESLNARRQIIAQIPKEVEKLDEEQLNSKAVLNQLLSTFSAPPPNMQPAELDLIRFVQSDALLINKVREFGELESGPSATKSCVLGEQFKLIVDRYATIQVQLCDVCGDQVTGSGYVQFLNAKLYMPDGFEQDVNLTEQMPGLVGVGFMPKVEGLHILHVTLQGALINNCPTHIEVRRGRNYADISKNGELFHFGGEGSRDGELCRPWGICCDLKGRIVVADRSNNRIQIFDPDGNFLLKFGSGGSKPGQFDRPAGVCVNSHNQIIVADKDNHRIQVFNEEGHFVFKFGERGRPVGMFNYPWGVATNSKNNIAVSDTRNHRVQIFSSNGQFLRKCGFDTAYFYKHLDSPRGVCYLPNGQLLITDFNNHRVVLIQGTANDMKCFGSEGDQEGMFLRPQGICVDLEGHVLVCDSRNNRVQVFAVEDMHCVTVIGGVMASIGVKAPMFPQQNAAKGGSSMGVMPLTPALPSPYRKVQQQFNDYVQQIGSPLFNTTQDTGENGPSTATDSDLFDRPTDVCVGADGRIYVVDFGRHCIRVF